MWRVPPDVSASPDFARVEIRLVRSQEEFAACEVMSREIWGAAERNVVPRELLLTMQLNGGLVHGAFAPDGRLVGFCFAFLGRRDGQLRLCSHQLGVIPELRGGGINVSPGRTALIWIPADIQVVKRQSLELALAWRMESRAAFEAALAAGLVAVDFQRQGVYVMAPAS